MSNINEVTKQLANKELPVDHRKKMAVDLLVGSESKTLEVVLERMAADALSEEAKEAQEFIMGMVENLQRAPMRPATFVGLVQLDSSKAPHALVVMDNGEFGYMVVHDIGTAKSLKLGDRVALDGKATILIDRLSGETIQYGNESRFERRLDERHIEVTCRDERVVVLTHHALMNKIEAQFVNPGDSIIIGSSEKVAFTSLPKAENIGHYRFLDRGPIPDIVVDRDIGSPPQVIEAVSRHVFEEMTRPEMRRRFKLRPCITRLLSGVSGSGKTLAVQAIHHRIYDIMATVTGMKPSELPHRVFRFKTSQILSMWLGESDKNADRIFDEIEKLTQETFTNDKGKVFKLPVMVIMEEAEGMGRQRGDSHDSVYDRILSTLLQRLDPNRAGLSDQLVVFLSTTNEPHLVDPAFLRRIGGSVEHFGRLSREAFVEVFRKLTDGLPAFGEGTQKRLWRDMTQELEAWLYDQGEGETGVVELVGGGQRQTKFARDFLTGALVDRSIQEAATTGWEASLKDRDAAITTSHLRNAVLNQVHGVARQLTPTNVIHYLDIPEDVKITSVKSLINR